LYLAIAFYLLPALAATLKIRKRKLAQTNEASFGLVSNTGTDIEADLALVNNKKLLTNLSDYYVSSRFIQSNALASKISILSLKIEITRKFHLSLLSQARLLAFFLRLKPLNIFPF